VTSPEALARLQTEILEPEKLWIKVQSESNKICFMRGGCHLFLLDHVNPKCINETLPPVSKKKKETYRSDGLFS